MIELDQVCISYTKEFNTLQDVCLNIPDGDKLVVVGELDSGKTALLRAIVGLDKIKSGSLSISGVPIDRVDFKNDIALGFIPSEPVFFENKTVEENLKYVLDIRSKDKKLTQVYVTNAICGYELSMKEDEKLKNLGRLDRLNVALARLSLRNLDVIVIDDIFDMLSDYELKKIIKSIKDLIKSNNATAIITTSSDKVANLFGYKTVHIRCGSIIENKNEEEKDNV